MNQFSFPVNVQTKEYRRNGTVIYFPSIVHYDDPNMMRSINQMIEETALQLIERQIEEQGIDQFNEMIGLYEIKTNERNVLSMTFTNYAIHENFAHGLTLMDSLTFDLNTGKKVVLSNLFKAGKDYREKLSKHIKAQLEQRKLPTLTNNITVSENQGFYIADQVLVLYYQVYEITPHYVGIPMFPIPVYELEDLILQEGVLGRMLG